MKQAPAHIGKETLGVHLAPDGNCNDAVKILRQKAEHWHNQITTGRISPEEAWRCVDSTITKTLEYPLPALSLTKTEYKYIMHPVKEAGLAQAKVCRRYPLDLVYGSTDLMGLGLKDLYVY